MRYSEFPASAAARLKQACFYTPDECRALARRLLFTLSQLGHSLFPVVDAVQLALHGGEEIPKELMESLDAALARLVEGEPLEYVVGFAEFCGRRFNVNSSTLIPRPETEELVALASDYIRGRSSNTSLNVVDCCTGSGCIAWSLLPLGCAVAGCDISSAALKVASSQPFECEERPLFFECDLLRPYAVEVIAGTLEHAGWYREGGLVDVIVSNPPYVTQLQRSEMRPNVLNWEPASALFVENEDPLLFYRKIADIALKINSSKECKEFSAPALFFEINEGFGFECREMIRGKGWNDVQCIKDLFGKERFVVAK